MRIVLELFSVLNFVTVNCLVVVNSLLKKYVYIIRFLLIVCSTLLGSCEQALLPPSLVCGSEGTVSHQGAAVSFSYLSRLQIILEYA